MTKTNLKYSTKLLVITIFSSILISGCSNYEAALKTIPNEIAQANECKSENKGFESDCYDLISYKNSIPHRRVKKTPHTTKVMPIITQLHY